jgi:hypothetical protein
MEPAEASALVGAGLLSVLIFPISALTLLRSATDRGAGPAEPEAASSGAPTDEPRGTA